MRTWIRRHRPRGAWRTLRLLSGLAVCWSIALGVDDLVGSRPPAWSVNGWFNSPPLALNELRGRVVLVRWWTAPHCQYCAATAPALNEFFSKYHQQGLEVIGLYHNKSSAPLDPKAVRRHAKKFGFKFPVAIDPDWRTLKQWWLRGEGQDWTSVSFLLDRQGIVRHIHPGGQYVKGDAAYAVMEAKIRELLAEN